MCDRGISYFCKKHSNISDMGSLTVVIHAFILASSIIYSFFLSFIYRTHSLVHLYVIRFGIHQCMYVHRWRMSPEFVQR